MVESPPTGGRAAVAIVANDPAACPRALIPGRIKDAVFGAELVRDPRAPLAKLLAQPNPFAENGTNEPERPLNHAQRRRLASRQRAA